MRFDPNHADWSGYLKRCDGLRPRLRPGGLACMWGAMAGNLPWQMLRMVGRRGKVWCQEPDSALSDQARDFLILPNLDWCSQPLIQWPGWHTCDVCVIDWVPHGGDHLVLEALRDWPALASVRSMMTEQRDPSIESWMHEHGFQHAADSQACHEWWDR